MSDPASAPPRARWRHHIWWGLPIAAVLILLLIEISAPAHAAFAELDLFLFHGLFGILVSVAMLVIAGVIEHVLARPGIYGDD